jgi:hypothetical protein
MAQKDVDTLIQRADDAWAQKELWEDELEDAYDYAMPNRNRYDEETPGDSKTEKLYDSTAIQATQSFASKLQNKLTPPFEDWFSLKAGPVLEGMADGKEQMHEINSSLDQVTKMVNQVFNLGSFNQAIHEFYLDLATGQGGMLVQAGNSVDRPVKFTAVNRADYAIEDGADNEIKSVYRQMKLCGRDIKQQWNDADLPEKMSKQIEQDEDQEFEFWEITYESEREDSSSPNDTVWYYDVIWQGGSEDGDNRRIVERTYRSNPWVIARWSKLAGENEGRGPLLNALPDIRTLNKVVELTLKNASLAISGAYTVANDGVTNPDNIQIKPGALIPVARNAGPNGPSIAPLQSDRDFDVGQLITDDLRMQIKSMLFDSGVPEQRGKTPNSATEIAQRVENLQQEIGGSFGRLFKELIVPLVQRVIDILYANQMIDIPAKVDTLGIRLQVTSPLARGQNFDDIKNVTQFIDLASQVAGKEAMISKLKPDDIIDFFGDKLGVPQKLRKSPEEQQAMMEQMKQVAKQAQAQQQQAQGQPQQRQQQQTQSPA